MLSLTNDLKNKNKNKNYSSSIVDFLFFLLVHTSYTNGFLLTKNKKPAAGLPREVHVDESPSLEVFKTCADGELSDMV